MSRGRSYHSSLRAEQAAETRRRIRQAARRLFGEHGFAETTVAQIAEGAGVAAPTIYSAFGSKGGVVSAMLEDLEEAADREGWEQRIRSASAPAEQLRLFVRWIRTLFEQGAPVLRAAMAARSDPDVAAMMERGDGNRLGGTTALAEHWAAAGALRDGVPTSVAAHTLWLLTSPEQYLLATDRLGWTPDRYERWLAPLAAEAILRTTSPPRPDDEG